MSGPIKAGGFGSIKSLGPSSSAATKPSTSPTMIAAAIDFGTTFSGYAFSFQHDFARDPLAISSNHWIGGGHISLKAPTTALFTPGKVFHSFGYEAEDHYTELAEDDNHRGWYYFKRFKMLLHNNKAVSRSTLLTTDDGQTMEAIVVFSAVISYLKDHLMGVIVQRTPDITQGDVHWVLTVPAIWGDSAKQFMREAAQLAGIEHDNLSLALEPEAAAIYCHRLPHSIGSGGSTRGLTGIGPGSTYMVIDLGGGTVDIAVHLMRHDGTIAEIAKASGGAWGGTQVDDAFMEFLHEIFKADIIQKFQQSEKLDYLELLREFEIKKRNVSPSMSGKINMKIPTSLRDCYERNNYESLEERIEQTQYAGKVVLTSDKMRMSSDILQGYFEYSISQTIEHISGILTQYSEDINTILLVGGFAESSMVREEVRKSLPHMSVIIPDDAGLAVLKGAVLFGHDPHVVQARISKYTYGTEFNANYDPAIHREDYKVWSNGAFRCRYTFDPFVRANQPVDVDEVVTNVYRSDELDVKEGFGVYASTSEIPKYVTDSSCFLLGKVFLQHPGHTVRVHMKFGGTEFMVTTHDLNTDTETTDKFDFLLQ